MTHDLEDSAVIPRAELAQLSLTAADWRDALTKLADHAFEAGYVEPTFKQALLDREEAFPTGLPTAIPVAIPHADVEHVRRPGLAVAVLEKPVPFGEMGSLDGAFVAARVLVMILVTQPHDQLDQLTRLIGVFQRDGWYETLEQAASPAELAERFTELLGDPA